MNERFWAKVVKTDDCWIWIGAKRDGYGMFWQLGKLVSAHRVSWKLSFGEIPQGKLVLHKCDNRKCVNPGHLFLGTHEDNFQDCIQKGHLGYVAPHPKLNETSVREIKLALLKGETHRILASKYGVHSSLIDRIASGKRWKHIKI